MTTQLLAAAANPPHLFPPEATKIILTLFLSSLIGLEREEHKATVDRYVFGGIRTFPLIGLLGYAMALISGTQLLPLAVGFAVVASFLWLSYQHKLQSGSSVGVTTEISGLTTYVVGALVSLGHFWIAGTLGVLSVLLLELKFFLEGLTRKIPAQEIFTFSKFLFLTIVILPIVPNQNLGPYGINLFKTWLVVVAVSAVSYGSYLLEVFTKEKGGMLLSAILGGAYSSTVTTIVLAKRAKEEESSAHLFSGAILTASGVMYLKLAVLIGVFSRELLEKIAAPLVILGVVGMAAGWIWTRLPDQKSGELKKQYVPRNPLELQTAILFGALFVAMLVLTDLAVVHLGERGIFGLAAIMGIVNVDPFVLSLTQSAGSLTPMQVAAGAILISTASNNAFKAMYAYGFADRRSGMQAMALLGGYTVVGLAPLIWLMR